MSTVNSSIASRLRRIAWWSGIAGAAVAVAVLVFLIGQWTAPSGSAGDASTDTAAPDAEPAPEQVYTCPMHPSVRTTNPNDLCPICAMELVPLDEGDGDDADGDVPRLRVSERAAALMHVQTVPARRAVAEREVRLYGRVTVDERLTETITAWAPGRIVGLHIDFTGQRIERDQPMVDLYSPELITAQQELLSALGARDRFGEDDQLLARTSHEDVDAARDRLRLLGVSASFIDELETTGEVHDTITINAPRSGIVTQRFASEGAYVSIGDPLYAIVDLSQVWVTFDAFETDLPWLREGQSATFETQAVPGETFEGIVTFIDPVLDDRTRTVRARLDVPNPDGRLRPGMFVQGTVRAVMNAEGQAQVGVDDDRPLIIPVSAPLITGRRAVVYVQVPSDDRPTFEARNVHLGPRAGDTYIVFDGLEEGENVVVHGQFRIDSELQIRGRSSMMQPPSDESAEATAPVGIADDHPARSVSPDAVPDAIAAQLADVLEHYLAMADALSLDDAEAAADALQNFHVLLYELDVAGLPDDVRDAWSAIDRDLHGIIHELSAPLTIESLRDVLEPLTEYMALTVSHFIGDRTGTVYRAHCPMVDDFRGADWLQRERQIANPYFGSQMFRCGEIVGEVLDERPQDDAPTEQQGDRETEPRDESDEPADTDGPGSDVPEQFEAAAHEALVTFDEIVRAVEAGHVDHARDAVAAMQDALFALELDALRAQTRQVWLDVDVQIMEALRVMLEADSADAMRERLPALRDAVDEAREMLSPAANADGAEGGDA